MSISVVIHTVQNVSFCMNNSEIHVCVYSTNKLPYLCEAYWAVIVKFTLKVKCGMILYEYQMKYTEYQISFDCMNNAGKKHKLRLSQIQSFKYHWLHCSCIAEPLWHFVWLDVQQTLCSGVLSASSDVTTKMENTGV